MASPEDCLMDSDVPQDRVLLQDRGTLQDDVIAFKEMSQCVEGETERDEESPGISSKYSKSSNPTLCLTDIMVRRFIVGAHQYLHST